MGSEVNTTSFLLRDVKIFTGERIVALGYVLVRNGKIASFGESDPPLPDGTPLGIKQLSLPGHTVLPGFIDCHVHAFLGDDRCLSVSLPFGITTVLDMHNEPEYVRKLKALVSCERSCATYADFKTAGLCASVENGYPFRLVTEFIQDPAVAAAAEYWVKLRHPEEAAGYVDNRLREGSDYIKLMQDSGKTWGWEDMALPSRELQAAIVQAARERGLVTVAHAMTLADTLAVLRAGVDGLAHTFCDEPVTDELVQAYTANSAFVCPTLAATGSMTTDGMEHQKKVADDLQAKGLLDDEEHQRLCACMATCQGRGKLEYAINSVKVLKDAGIDIVCGSDSVGPGKPGTGWGASYFQELRLFVDEVGMTPQEALRSATSVPARRFGLGDRGVIEPGRKADLVLVKGDPLKDMDDLLNLKGVWRDGHLCQTYGELLE